MADRYTIEQFPDLHLPGFENEATIWDVAGSDTDWQTVLSLSIYNLNPSNDTVDVLTAIRTDDTETHPRVVSTPTGRFPQQFQMPILQSRKAMLRQADHSDWPPAGRQGAFTSPGHFRLKEVNTKEYQPIATFYPNIVDLPNRNDPFAYLTHEILARKLGMGEALQKKKDAAAIGTVSLSDVIAGFSYAADDEKTDEPLWEPLLMYAGVMVLNDRSLIPPQTAAYRSIGWTPIGSFSVGHITKSAEMLVPTIEREDEATVCVRGLCLTATNTVTLRAGFKGHLGV